MQRYIDPNFNLPWPGHDSRWSSLLYKIFSITWPGHDSIWPLFFYNILGIILVDRIYMWLSTPSDVDQYIFTRDLSDKRWLGNYNNEARIWMQFFYKRTSGAYAQWLLPDQGEARRDHVMNTVWDILTKEVLRGGFQTHEITDPSVKEALTHGDSRYGLFVVSDHRYLTSKIFISVLPIFGKDVQVITSNTIQGDNRLAIGSEEEVDRHVQKISEWYDIHSSQKWDFREAFNDFQNANDSYKITVGN
eukprot:GHVQ01039785.1.p1 GENE.GHVQ01039785.1~~GHVQ01039785.1.p1  ORF type:complete len:247 (+),score=16.67 GHVQ01039785.1:242-982(+)